MVSAIDPNVIGAGAISKAGVKLQFQRAKDEISALQAKANVPTITALRAASIIGLADNDYISVGGYASRGDGGFGPFFWSAISTATDDGGSVIKPSSLLTSDPGRYIAYFPDSEFPIARFGAKEDGTTVDDAAMNAAVAAATAAGGGWVTSRPNKSVRLTTKIDITTNKVGIDGRGATFVLVGQGGIRVRGVGSLGGPVLSANAAINAKVISLSSLAGLGVGSYLYLQRNAPDNGGATGIWSHITQVKAVSGVGPFNVTLVDPLPFALGTADAGQLLRNVSMVSQCGVRNATFDGTALSGAATSAVEATWTRDCEYSNLSSVNCILGAGFYAQFGYGNRFNGLRSTGSGNPSYDAIFIISQTLLSGADWNTISDAGFGIQCQSCTKGHVRGVLAGSSGGRGLKIQSCVGMTLMAGSSGAHAYNGVALSIGSQRNVLFGFHTHNNALSEGFWCSDQFNTGNIIFGLQSANNASYDVYVGITDTGNTFIGGSAPIIACFSSSTLFYGFNGVPLQRGDATGTTVPLYGLTANGLAEVPARGVGTGAERWIGGDGGDGIYYNVPTGNSHTFALNNGRILNIAGDGLRFLLAAGTTPTDNSSGTMQLISNTQLRFVVKGSDGTVRATTPLTLA